MASEPSSPILVGNPGAQNAGRKAEILAAVSRVLDANRYINGPEVAAFEKEFAAVLGTKDAVGVANGTEALALALRAVGVVGRASPRADTLSSGERAGVRASVFKFFFIPHSALRIPRLK